MLSNIGLSQTYANNWITPSLNANYFPIDLLALTVKVNFVIKISLFESRIFFVLDVFPNVQAISDVEHAKYRASKGTQTVKKHFTSIDFKIFQ